jgi:hypothetical protein
VELTSEKLEWIESARTAFSHFMEQSEKSREYAEKLHEGINSLGMTLETSGNRFHKTF